jgi:hypothetical protein
MGTVTNSLKTLRFDIVVVSQRFETASSQELLNDFLVTVPTALEADQTLDDTANSVTVVSATNYGPLNFADSVFLAVQLDVEVTAT